MAAQAKITRFFRVIKTTEANPEPELIEENDAVIEGDPTVEGDPAIEGDPAVEGSPADEGDPIIEAGGDTIVEDESTSAPVSPLSPLPTSETVPDLLKRALSPDPQPEAANKRLRTFSFPSNGSVDPELYFPRERLNVWATSRGDFCDSQLFFKSYNAGSYHRDGKVLGLYISNYDEPRDFLGRAKLVTCVGGCRVQLVKNGPWVRKNTKPKEVQYWMAVLNEPVVVVIGHKHPGFKDLELPKAVRERCAFLELGAFIVTKIWKEMMQPTGAQAAYPVWKVMLQTMNPTSTPWYWKDGEESSHGSADIQDTIFGDESNELDKNTCGKCGETSPRIFDNAPWVCLEESCKQFFEIEGKLLSQIGDDEKELRYSKAFVNQITPFENVSNIPRMFEPVPAATNPGQNDYGTEKALRSGMTCPECKCCTSRKFWDKLACRICGFQYDTAPRHYPLSEVEKETIAHTKRFKTKNGDGVTIKLDQGFVDSFTELDKDGKSSRFVYMIRNVDGLLIGTFVVERPSDAAKKAPGGADELYMSIEADSSHMKFQRNAARCPGSTGETLTRHFQSNFGAPYDFGVRNISTVPFKDAPDVVHQSLVYLRHFGQKALKSSQEIASVRGYQSVANSTLDKGFKDYNELLALAYRETDKIDWHDDGEDQVTGVISTASLGSPGRMSLGFPTGKSTKKPKPILEVQLQHGDVATMCDTRLQALTLHTVNPDGIRRYAMTSRTIDFDFYRQPKQQKKLVKRGMTVKEMEEQGQLPDRALRFSYNGTTLGDQ